MGDQQTSLGLDAGYDPAPAAVPEIRDEIAAAWSLPLGQRVEICFRGAERSSINGILELLRAPDYPWDRHQSLKLRIAGFIFGYSRISMGRGGRQL
jgi:hypothetical protein